MSKTPDKTNVRAALDRLEWSGKANGGACCPVCQAQPPLDADNPRAWEIHTDDCILALAIADVR